MKKAISFLIAMAVSVPFGFSSEVNPRHVSRVVEMCHGKSKEINIAALEQAAQVLRATHPELAAELEKIAIQSSE